MLDQVVDLPFAYFLIHFSHGRRWRNGSDNTITVTPNLLTAGNAYFPCGKQLVRVTHLGAFRVSSVPQTIDFANMFTLHTSESYPHLRSPSFGPNHSIWPDLDTTTKIHVGKQSSCVGKYK